MNSPNKYKAVRTQVNNLTFASKREAARYQELLLLERAKIIKDLKLQVWFPLEVNKEPICAYVADFVYLENGLTVVEDSKGVRTDAYRIKKKLMKALYQIEIKET